MSLGYKESFNESAALSQPHEAAKRFVEGQLDAENRQDMNGADPDGGLNGRMRTAASNARLANGNTESEKKKRERTAALMRSVAAIEAQLAKLYERRDQLMGEIDQLEQEISTLGSAVDKLQRGEELPLDGNGELQDKELERMLKEYERQTGKKIDRTDSGELLQTLTLIEQGKLADLSRKERELDDVNRDIDVQERKLASIREDIGLDAGGAQANYSAGTQGQYGLRQDQGALLASGLGGHVPDEVRSRSTDYAEDVVPDDVDVEEFMQQLGAFDGIDDLNERQLAQAAIIMQYPEIAEYVAKTEPVIAAILDEIEAEAAVQLAQADVQEAEPEDASAQTTQTAAADPWGVTAGVSAG